MREVSAEGSGNMDHLDFSFFFDMFLHKPNYTEFQLFAYTEMRPPRQGFDPATSVLGAFSTRPPWWVNRMSFLPRTN